MAYPKFIITMDGYLRIVYIYDDNHEDYIVSDELQIEYYSSRHRPSASVSSEKK